MYYNDLIETAVNDETSVEFNLRQKEAADAIKKLDKYYEKYSIPYNNTWRDGKYYKYITVENFGSGSTGNYVRNAVTGVRYDIQVGSAKEDTLFKVIDSTGRNGRKEPFMLYYDSPEQHENHHFVIVSPEIKVKWHKKSSAARKRFSM